MIFNHLLIKTIKRNSGKNTQKLYLHTHHHAVSALSERMVQACYVLFYCLLFYSMFYCCIFMAHSDVFTMKTFPCRCPFPLTIATPALSFLTSSSISTLSSSLISGGICRVSYIEGSNHLQIGIILYFFSHSCPFICFSCLITLAKGFKPCIE